MLFDALTSFTLCVAISTIVECRDIGKNFKSIPSISNSLVNLGKMDVSIYFNAKEPSMRSERHSGPATSYLFSQSEPVEEPCPCSSLRGFKDPFSKNPSDFLNKLLMSNDLFSYKEPTSSTMCCESHEHDDFVTFEFGNNHMNANPLFSGSLPLVFDTLLPRKPQSSFTSKPKAFEVFFFPRKKDLYMPVKNIGPKKEATNIVGDKKLRNEFISNKYKPTTSASVKKDLTAQQKNEMPPVADVDDVHVVTAVNNNSLLPQ